MFEKICDDYVTLMLWTIQSIVVTLDDHDSCVLDGCLVPSVSLIESTLYNSFTSLNHCHRTRLIYANYLYLFICIYK